MLEEVKIVIAPHSYHSDTRFYRIIKNIVMHHFYDNFYDNKRHINVSNFWQKPKRPILEEFLGFFYNVRTFLNN